ncbi:oligosaccharide flippase family protein [Vibrio natriegens]|uniref:oligosaccharide flippase family protein n=1 Tax=Vibrio natriegens TaxID=691 RepID=UPI003B5C2D45
MLVKQSLILIISRILNYGILIFSPILLVRILDVESYGLYREFILFSTLFITFFSLSLKFSVVYYISEDKKLIKDVVSQEIYIVLFVSTFLLISILYLGQIFIDDNIYLFLLAFYVFFSMNADYYESVNIALKKPKAILLYTLTYTSIKTCLLLSLAYSTKSVYTIIIGLIFSEIARVSFVIIYSNVNNWVFSGFNFEFCRKLLIYSLPLSVATGVFTINTKLGELIINNSLGVEYLAIYTIGIYQVPIISIIRNAISDTIFPRIVQESKEGIGNNNGLTLWRNSNIVMLAIISPFAFILYSYSNEFISFLFTSKYSESVPIFQIFILLMIRQCFEMGVPLRAKNKNRSFVVGNIISLIVNITLSLFLIEKIGIIGPAIAFLISDFSLNLFLFFKIKQVYNCSWGTILHWKDIIKVIFCVSISVLFYLVLSNCIEELSVVLEISAIFIFLFVYIILLKLSSLSVIKLFFKGRVKNEGNYHKSIS